MTAHKHAEIIKAKAGNMDLVVFRKHHDGDWIEVADQGEIRIKQSGEYFLCLNKHKKAVLNVLNGGDSEVNYGGELGIWEACNCGQPIEFGRFWWYMNPEAESRIKPRKEKRWVAFKWDNFYVLPRHYETKEQAESAAASTMMGEFQYKEIEVEI